MSTGAFSQPVSLEIQVSWSSNSRSVVPLYASQLQAHWDPTGPTCRTASLDHRSHLHPRIRNLLVHLDFQQKTLSPRMLWNPRHQSDLLHGDSAGMLSDLPTLCLQLESFSSRNMWGPEVLGLIHRSLQPVDGCRYSSITIARFVGASDADREEDRSKRPIFYGNSVRLTSHSRVLPLQST